MVIAQDVSRGLTRSIASPVAHVGNVRPLEKGEKLMSAANWSNRIASARSNPVPPLNWLAERVRYYFDRHPEASREEFLLEAIRREIHFREQREKRNRGENQEAGRFSIARPAGGARLKRASTSAEAIRLHAWLNERLAVLHYERHGLWPRLRRLFFGSRPG
jgi:hypothetical protein